MIQTPNFVLQVTELVLELLDSRNIHFLMKNVPQDPKINEKLSKNGPVTIPGGLSDDTLGEKRSPDSILRSLGRPQVELWTLGGGQIHNFLVNFFRGGGGGTPPPLDSWLTEGEIIPQHESLASGHASTVSSFCKRKDLTPTKFPRTLECEWHGGRLSSAARSC